MNDLSYQLLSSFIAIVIPLLFVVLIIDNKDNRRIILFFCWGVFSGVLAYNINNYFGYNWSQYNRMILSIAPMIEEVCKGLPVLLFFNRKKYPNITRQIVFCAMTSGIGFSIQESIYYFAISPREINDITSLIIRTLTTSLMHGMTTAFFGFGLMLFSKLRLMIIPVIFGLFAFSVSIHALYNLLLQTHFAFVALIIPLAMFATGWWIVKYSKFFDITEH